MSRDTGLDTLLELDSSIIDQGDGYWIKIDAWEVDPPTKERPHGIRYSLTLHDSSNQRIMGFDNAHAVKPTKSNKYKGRRIEYDHKHRSIKDKGISYEFTDAYQLLKDFFKDVDCTLIKHRDY